MDLSLLDLPDPALEPNASMQAVMLALPPRDAIQAQRVCKRLRSVLAPHTNSVVMRYCRDWVHRNTVRTCWAFWSEQQQSVNCGIAVNTNAMPLLERAVAHSPAAVAALVQSFCPEPDAIREAFAALAAIMGTGSSSRIDVQQLPNVNLFCSWHSAIATLRVPCGRAVYKAALEATGALAAEFMRHLPVAQPCHVLPPRPAEPGTAGAMAICSPFTLAYALCTRGGLESQLIMHLGLLSHSLCPPAADGAAEQRAAVPPAATAAAQAAQAAVAAA